MGDLSAAVARMKEASEMSLHYYQKPLLIVYSGGKDSDAVVEVAKVAGIPYEVQHSHTTADAPETVRHVRMKFHKLENDGIKCTIDYPMYRGKRTSMWELIPQKTVPPTRLVRYCCSVLKETGGAGRFIATGVRWAESTSRQNSRGIMETMPSDIKKKIILNNDNDDKRLLFEGCARLGKKTVNPIVDWSDADVWDFLRDQKTECNPLYCEFARVGCVGCPMASKAREREFARWPKYKRLYLQAFERMIEARRGRGLAVDWQTGMDVFNWWMEYDILPGQIDLLEEEP